MISTTGKMLITETAQKVTFLYFFTLTSETTTKKKINNQRKFQKIFETSTVNKCIFPRSLLQAE